MTDLFMEILNLSITASWLIAAVLLVRFLFRKAPRGILCLLWVIVAVRLIFPFDLESALSLIPTDEPITSEMILENEGEAAPDLPADQPTYDAPIYTPENAQNDAPAYIPDDTPAYIPEAPVIDTPPEYVAPTLDNVLQADEVDPPLISTEEESKPVTALDVISVAWLAGVAAMLLYCIISYIRIWRRVADSIPGEGNIRISERIASPFIFGIVRPRIYMPKGVTGKTAEYVIAHERSHIRYMDHLIKPFAFLILSVYWFNPFVWIAYVFLCRDIELACDERVLRKMDDEGRRAYASALIECGADRKLITACPLAFGEVGVKTRIKNALKYKKPMLWVIIAAILSVCVIAVCFLTNPISAEEGSESETETVTETESTDENETHTETTAETETESDAETEVDTETEPTTEEPATETETHPADTTEQPATGTIADDVTVKEPVVTSKPATTEPIVQTTPKIVNAKNFEMVVNENIRTYFVFHFVTDELSKCEVPNTAGYSKVYLIESTRQAELFGEVAEVEYALEKYSDTYFKENSLLVVSRYVSSSAYWVTFSDFAFDGKIFSGKATYVTLGGTVAVPCDSKTDLCLIEINGRFADDVKFSIVDDTEVEYVEPRPDPDARPTPTQKVLSKDEFSYTMSYYDHVNFDTFINRNELWRMRKGDNNSDVVIYEVLSKKELDLLINSINTVSSDRIICMTDMAEVLSKYDEEFFKENSLIILFVDSPYDKSRFEVSDFSFDGSSFKGEFRAYWQREKGDPVTNACILELNGRLPGETEYDVRSLSFDSYGDAIQRVINGEKLEDINYEQQSMNGVYEDHRKLSNDSSLEDRTKIITEDALLGYYYTNSLFDTFLDLTVSFAEREGVNAIIPNIDEIKEKYDANFFADHTLLVLYQVVPNAQSKVTVTDVYFSGKMLNEVVCDVLIQTTDSESETKSAQLVFVEIEGKFGRGAEFIMNTETEIVADID